MPCLAQDFDEWTFRRQLAEVFDTDPGDILLSISMTVLIRNGRVLTAVHQAANNLFNISIQRVDSMFETCEMLDANGKRHATPRHATPRPDHTPRYHAASPPRELRRLLLIARPRLALLPGSMIGSNLTFGSDIYLLTENNTIVQTETEYIFLYTMAGVIPVLLCIFAICWWRHRRKFRKFRKQSMEKLTDAMERNEQLRKQVS